MMLINTTNGKLFVLGVSRQIESLNPDERPKEAFFEQEIQVEGSKQI